MLNAWPIAPPWSPVLPVTSWVWLPLKLTPPQLLESGLPGVPPVFNPPTFENTPLALPPKSPNDSDILLIEPVKDLFAAVNVPSVWVWLGRFAVPKSLVASPPVLPTEYPLPAPTTNLSLKSGVLFWPLHNTQPLGIAFDAPDHIMIPPEGIA